MLTAAIAKTVDFSVRHAWRVIGVSVLLVLVCAVYAGRHFAINTDVGRLLDTDAPWAQREEALSKAFPQRGDVTLVVVHAPAPEFAAEAARELAARLQQQSGFFHSVTLADAGDFFTRNGLLFLDLKDVSDLGNKLTEARPLLNSLARDPSLRGLSNLLAVTLLVPLQTGQLHLPDMAPLLAHSADAVDAALAGRPGALSWRTLVDPGETGNGKGRSFIEVRPVLNYNDLEPGAASADAIRATAADLQLARRYGASVALTGAVPLSDEEFSSVQEGAVLSGIVTLILVLLILWFALRSMKLVAAVFLTMIGGLVVTAALGLLMVGALNIISVAFAVMFVGIGVDFGIQFGVRFREKRYHEQNVRDALVEAAHSIAFPLTLAATATAVGFLAFLPTDYRGVSELGQIAGVGILFVAFPSCMTLLPALIAVLHPKGREVMPGYAWLGPVDHLFQAHRKPLLFGTIAVILAGLPLLRHLHFDFNPLHLKDPNSESMATLLSLADSPQAGMDNLNVLSPSLAAAQTLAARLEQLPQVAKVMTLASFVPDRQPEKLQHIAKAAGSLLPVLQQKPAADASDVQRVAALRRAARALRNAALDHEGPGAPEARRLSASLTALAQADAAARDRAETAVALPLKLALADLQKALQPQTITLNNLPPELIRNWITSDGRALVEIAPKKAAATESRDGAQLRDFTQAVLKVAPDAAGGPITAQGSADLIIRAFIHAAALALVAITLLLWAALRRFDDVLFTVVPLLVSGLVTLELCVVFGISLNFANIIALPLLLGIGVAFKIYYVMAWRSGEGELLKSGLTQAIILSATTTGTAFGSLWLSAHPGTSSMGRLLVLSLVCTLIGAVFFQPILMGKPRHAAGSA
ncbi:MMPL family transporter [Noviherbaspirillum massiliense]|uniref:hopanoid transporter HpnN n=1 Tax=Noviherbaspirillum massiliense TaxID=1465823 RepID=UPI0002F7A1B5|nr:MMPL family transporter [Noviherbaspirillum massiliense]